jgi:hypothetical protein
MGGTAGRLRAQQAAARPRDEDAIANTVAVLGNLMLDHCLHGRRFGDVKHKLVIHAHPTIEFVRQVVAKRGE